MLRLHSAEAYPVPPGPATLHSPPTGAAAANRRARRPTYSAAAAACMGGPGAAEGLLDERENTQQQSQSPAAERLVSHPLGMSSKGSAAVPRLVGQLAHGKSSSRSAPTSGRGSDSSSPGRRWK